MQISAEGRKFYVRSLVDTLKPLAIESVIAAPGQRVESYTINECEVHRFDASKKLTTEMMYGMGDPLAAERFGKHHDDTKPNLVHFHSFTSSASVLALRECRARGIRAITTYHTPHAIVHSWNNDEDGQPALRWSSKSNAVLNLFSLH
ncbi:MAG: glycosyltransferase [Pirellulales bacterium]